MGEKIERKSEKHSCEKEWGSEISTTTMVVLIMPENKTDEHKHMMAAVFSLVFFL